MILSSASWTRYSDSASRADVASSRSRICGDPISARAMAILCFWPPDKVTPLSPTMVSSLSGNLSINSQALAWRAAVSTCSRVTFL
mmetsp:Transcript_7584/g.12249  ORF Transcript_7584/g.12249 Transcript_7584/m.12249 type:complete len:86 (-) Transcript_7584:969-1226(-)